MHRLSNKKPSGSTRKYNKNDEIWNNNITDLFLEEAQVFDLRWNIMLTKG